MIDKNVCSIDCNEKNTPQKKYPTECKRNSCWAKEMERNDLRLNAKCNYIFFTGKNNFEIRLK